MINIVKIEKIDLRLYPFKQGKGICDFTLKTPCVDKRSYAEHGFQIIFQIHSKLQSIIDGNKLQNGTRNKIDYGLPKEISFIELYSGNVFEIIDNSYYNECDMFLAHLKRNYSDFQFPEIINDDNYYIIRNQGKHRLAKKKVKPETLWKKLLELHNILES